MTLDELFVPSPLAGRNAGVVYRIEFAGRKGWVKKDFPTLEEAKHVCEEVFQKTGSILGIQEIER